MTSHAARESTGFRTVADLVPRAAEKFGSHVAIRHKVGDVWRDITVLELAERVEVVARSLIALGVERGERVCILGSTRPEWTVTALGVAMAGAVVVPIYPSSSTDECAWVIGHSEAVVVVGEGPEEAERIARATEDLTGVRMLLSMDSTPGVTRIDDVDVSDVTSDMLDQRWSGVRPEDPFAFVYTSGTTGPAKACVHTHGGYRAALATIRARDALHGADDLVYLFLPLAHVFALMIQLAALDVGTPVAYVSGKVEQVFADLAEVRPTFLPSVPRIFEKLYTLITAEIPPERLVEITQVGLQVRELMDAGTPLPNDVAVAFTELDATVFAHARAAFGGQLREAASGAAPIARSILEFFYAAGVPVMEGWGLTETAVAVTTSSRACHRFGTVGRAVPGVELRLSEDREILVRGPNVFAGYHNAPEATAETLKAGWLHTGDLGSFDDDGYLTIVGRKKDILITAGGKNIAPANLENAMTESRWVSRAVLHGDGRPYPVLLVTLDPDQLLPWAESVGLPRDLATLSCDARVRALVQEHLDSVNARFASAAQAKKFAILDHELTQAAGELTPTLKVRRNVVNHRYRHIFDALYRDS